MRNLVKEHDKRLLSSGVYRGYKWEVLDNAMGYRCGYVAIPRGHPYFEQDIHSLPIDCHGGLTFGRIGDDSTVDGDDYWVGFDCGHSFDGPDPALYFLSDVHPAVQEAFRWTRGNPIRTTEYVEKECENIIEQLIIVRLNPHSPDEQAKLRRFVAHPPASE